MATSGEIYVNGKKTTIRSVTEGVNAGVILLPEDRQNQALILDWEISKNIGLGNLSSFTDKKIWYNRKAENEAAQNMAEKLSIKASTIFDKVSSLSGGNQQKVVVAKLLVSDANIVIMDEPTKGVDIGAKAAIYEIISNLVENGYGVILISSEMPEVLGIADRIVVMRAGRVAAEFDIAESTQEKILAAAIMND